MHSRSRSTHRSTGPNDVGNPFLATPLSILFLQLRPTQNVFPSMRFLIWQITKSHAERDLANNGGSVITLAFDFWPETA